MKLYIFLFILFLRFPLWSQTKIEPFSEAYFHKQNFAHRGGYAYGPENSLSTILFNLEKGVTALEIDVQLTSDNQLVLFHDPTVERILQTKKATRIRELSLQELKRIPFRDTTRGKIYVTTLEELTDTLNSLLPLKKYEHFLLEIDFKPAGKETVAAVEELLRILKKNQEQTGQELYDYFFVSTFYPEVLKEIRTKDKRIKLAYAINPYSEDKKIKALIATAIAFKIVKKFDIAILEPHMCMVGPHFVRKWKKRKVLLNAWTANTRCEKNYLDSLEIAYTTNCPLSYCEANESDLTSKPVNWCKKCMN